MTSDYRKAPCRCGHGKSIHHGPVKEGNTIRVPCHYPSCKCRDYEPQNVDPNRAADREPTAK